jgi:predicted ATPase
MKRIVITGGPGAGKTSALEMAKWTLRPHIGFACESATIVFGGGFPREKSVAARCAAQRAIFHVQRELESLWDGDPTVDALLCDRGTPDSAAYYPGPVDALYGAVGTTRAAELARYDAVIHMRPPRGNHEYQQVGLRTESVVEAARMDALIAAAWDGHPNRVFVADSHDFVAKMRRVMALIETTLATSRMSRSA